MTDKTKQLEKLKELHSKVVERLDNTDDTLLEGPLYKGLVDERIRLRTLAAGISLDISLLEAQIAADKPPVYVIKNQYDMLNTEEKKEIWDIFKRWDKKD